jgi:leucyl/phenylalanyl-tRNA---protein transferase
MKNFPLDDRPWISPDLADEEGLVGVGGDLTSSTLIKAYTDGVFPWFNEEDPILWWSPDPRAVIEFDTLHVSRSLARTIRKNCFHVTIDYCFDLVMRECGQRRVEGTWITESMLAAYGELHRMGQAHSLEVWHGDELAGGIYGVGIGAFFAGESMFHRVTDGSKIALVSLLQYLQHRGYELFDVQMTTEHTQRMGAVEIPREHYLKRLRAAVQKSHVRFV